jgi:hypothetical protein
MRSRSLFYLQGGAIEGQETSIITDYILKVKSYFVWSLTCKKWVFCHVKMDNVNCAYPFLDSQLLGLDICADTLIGNEMIRGVSGGQRKRATTGLQQLIACPYMMLVLSM